MSFRNTFKYPYTPVLQSASALLSKKGKKWIPMTLFLTVHVNRFRAV